MTILKKAVAWTTGGSDDVGLMESPETSVPLQDAPAAEAAPMVITDPDFSGTPQPIGPLTERVDWPRCALGAFVDIHGFEGVVIEIINQSIKVRSSERITQRFNAYRLKVLFAPPDRTVPVRSIQVAAPVVPSATRESEKESEKEKEPTTPPRVYIANPDFSSPVRAIRTYATQADFPQCAYGKHVEIPGYSGVVVEIVKGSLKVQAPEGRIRSFSAAALKKLYGSR